MAKRFLRLNWRKCVFILLNAAVFALFSMMELYIQDEPFGRWWRKEIIVYGTVLCIIYAIILWHMYSLSDQSLFMIDKSQGKKLHTLVFTMSLLCILPYIYLCLPGNIPYDTIPSIEYNLGIDRSNTMNPYMMNVLYGFVARIGIRINSIDVSIFLFLCVQVVFILLAFSHCVAYATRSLSNYIMYTYLAIIFLIYFGVPSFAVYAFHLGKDSIFALNILILTQMLLEYTIDSKAFLNDKRRVIILVVVSVGIGFTRNGAIWIPVLVSLCMAFQVKRDRKLWIGLVVTVWLFNAMMGACLQKEEVPIRESISLPIQQTAAIMKKHQSDINESDKKFVYSYLPAEAINSYNPQLADPVKNEFPSSLTIVEMMQFLEKWVDLIIQYPDDAAKAVINMTYGYYCPLAECDNSKPLLYIGIKRRSRLIQATTDITWENFDHQGLLSHWGAVLRNTSVLGVWMKPGIYTWLLIMITMNTLYKKRYQRLTALLPLWCVLLGCLCSPVNGYYRYMLPIIWTTPLIIPSVMCFK